MRSTFSAFATAYSALSASQKCLDVVGQNIGNMGVRGYTRQRVDLYSVASGGYTNRYSTRGHNAVGQGVSIGGISQVRDPFLDLRFRKETCKVSETDTKLGVLEGLEGVFDETAIDGLQMHISDFIKQLQALSDNSGSPEFDSIVKASATTLTKLFNQYSKQIGSVREEQEYNLQNVTISKVNGLLNNIAEINKSIRDDQIHGNPSLELQDARNMMIDELSTYIPISVNYTTVELAGGIKYDHMTIDLVGGANNRPLLDHMSAAQITATKDPVTNQMGIGYSYTAPDGTVTNVTNINGDISSGSIKGSLDMLNLSGEFDTPPTIVKGIGYYEKMLDAMALQFATMFNEANSFNGITPPDGGPDDRPLFGANGGGTITAGNISISDGWSNDDYGITATKDALPGDNSGQRNNILYMISLFEQKVDFRTGPPPGGRVIFNGTIQEAFSQTGNVLALEIESTDKILTNYVSVLTNISDLRDGLSAVSLDEEGINLLQFQKSYNAAARLMTTLDEALDTIINNMGRVGR